MHFFRSWVVFLAVGALTLNSSAAEISKRPHALYIEGLGRGGLWGLGYDFLLSQRFGLGLTTSFYQLDGQRTFTLSPYLSFYPIVSGVNRWMIQAGPQWVSEKILSPVPEWNGFTENGLHAVISTGYEYRSDFLFRAYGMMTAGPGGIAPWFGLSIGWAF